MRAALIGSTLVVLAALNPHVVAQSLDTARIVSPTWAPIVEQIREGDRHLVLYNASSPGLELTGLEALLQRYVTISDIVAIGTLEDVSSRPVRVSDSAVTPASLAEANWIESILRIRVERLLKNTTGSPVKQGGPLTVYRNGGVAMFGEVRVEAITSYMPFLRKGARYVIFGSRAMHHGGIIGRMYEEGRDGLLVSTMRDPEDVAISRSPTRDPLEWWSVDQAVAEIERELSTVR